MSFNMQIDITFLLYSRVYAQRQVYTFLTVAKTGSAGNSLATTLKTKKFCCFFVFFTYVLILNKNIFSITQGQ